LYHLGYDRFHFLFSSLVSVSKEKVYIYFFNRLCLRHGYPDVQNICKSLWVYNKIIPTYEVASYHPEWCTDNRDNLCSIAAWWPRAARGVRRRRRDKCDGSAALYPPSGDIKFYNKIKWHKLIQKWRNLFKFGVFFTNLNKIRYKHKINPRSRGGRSYGCMRTMLLFVVTFWTMLCLWTMLCIWTWYVCDDELMIMNLCYLYVCVMILWKTRLICVACCYVWCAILGHVNLQWCLFLGHLEYHEQNNMPM
jgi:hypothetical protein